MGRGFNVGANEGVPEMPINQTEAVKIAPDYLNSSAKDLEADDHADQFYGYYTIHTIKEGEVSGMLSVSGFPDWVAFNQIYRGGGVPSCGIVPCRADHWDTGIFSESDLITRQYRIESNHLWRRTRKKGG